MTLRRPFQNILGKGKNSSNKHFLLFAQCFVVPINYRRHHFELLLICQLQMLPIWISLKFYCLVKSYLTILSKISQAFSKLCGKQENSGKNLSFSSVFLYNGLKTYLGFFKCFQSGQSGQGSRLTQW